MSTAGGTTSAAGSGNGGNAGSTGDWQLSDSDIAILAAPRLQFFSFFFGAAFGAAVHPSMDDLLLKTA
jgi:hypothetical protein